METQPQFSRRHYRRFYQLARRYWHDGRHSGLVWVSRRKCYQAAADRLGMPREVFDRLFDTCFADRPDPLLALNDLIT